MITHDQLIDELAMLLPRAAFSNDPGCRDASKVLGALLAAMIDRIEWTLVGPIQEWGRDRQRDLLLRN